MLIEPLAPCKICGSPNLSLFAHTARCDDCGVLLCYPYPGDLIGDGTQAEWSRKNVLRYYTACSFRNHKNLTDMALFALDESFRAKSFDVLDYGGGGGQFALVFKSLFPLSTVYITDISDKALLDEWRPLNKQIPFKSFDKDGTRFDAIFMNDVFEHVSDPATVLKQIAGKLKDAGIVFIDTPKQFWLYPVTKLVSKKLHTKVLRGTVDSGHQQIWSRKAFELTARNAGLRIVKYSETSEFTMPASFYLDNMGIRNPLVRMVGRIFFASAKYIAKNKITAVLMSYGVHQAVNAQFPNRP